MHQVHLKRIEYANRKLPLIYHYITHFAPDRLDFEFSIERNGIVFHLKPGLVDASPPHSYTEITFETELETDFAIFTRDIPAVVVSETLTIVPSERRALETRKEQERTNLEEQLTALFPVVRDALNTYRAACRVALCRESAHGHLLARSIQAAQLYWGEAPDRTLRQQFPTGDTPFLLDAFAALSSASFNGDADIEYTVRDESGRTFQGVFENGYGWLTCHEQFAQKLDEIQGFIRSGWALEVDLVLKTLEFLYSGDYRMAILNAAATLEMVLTQFWESKQEDLRQRGRQGRERIYQLERKLKEAKKERETKHFEALLQVIVPEFTGHDLVTSGYLAYCAEAWRARCEKLAHPYVAIRSGESTQISSTDAWNWVVSIIAVIDRLREA